METQETTIENVDPNVVDATLESQTNEETNTETLETNAETTSTEAAETIEETTTDPENSATEYCPKLKFKVRDEEHDMPEWAKGFIKDEDTEKNFVDLFTAQQGIELAKKEREEFKGKYIKRYSEIPDVYAAYSYDLTYIIAEALKNTDGKGEVIRKYFLENIDFYGVTGQTKFDTLGDCNSKQFERLKIEDNQFLILK